MAYLIFPQAPNETFLGGLRVSVLDIARQAWGKTAAYLLHLESNQVLELGNNFVNQVPGFVVFCCLLFLLLKKCSTLRPTSKQANSTINNKATLKELEGS